MDYQIVLEMKHRLGSLVYLYYQGTENKGLITEKPLISNLLKPTDITDLLVNASVQETSLDYEKGNWNKTIMTKSKFLKAYSKN